MALAPDRVLSTRRRRGFVTSDEEISVQTVVRTDGKAEFGTEVPASLARLQPRSIGGFSFWRMEVAVEPRFHDHVTEEHALVVARHPYSALWSTVARFRPGGHGPTTLPASIDSVDKVQQYVDHELEHDPWETGDRLVAGVVLPAAAIDAGTSPAWGYGYLLGACVDPFALEHALVRELDVKPLVGWSDAGYYSPADSLSDESEQTARRNILLQVAIRLAIAGPAALSALSTRDVASFAQSIVADLAANYASDLVDLHESLALVSRSGRRFDADLPAAYRQREAAEKKGRLVYEATAPDVLVPRYAPMPDPIGDGQILTQLRSLTLCCTDVSNLRGVLGHGHGEAKILGHENCNLVLESEVDSIPPGSFVVPLGDDWLGLAEFEVFRPVLPEDDPGSVALSFESRGTYYDPDSHQHIKAVCVVPEWRSGISLIEPLTHVYTYFVSSHDASMARTVVVLGAGACGMFFARFVRLFGAARHIAIVDVMDERLELARALDLADSTWNYQTDADACEALVADTKGTYADVVFDALPGRLPPSSPQTRRLGMRLLKPQGEYILYSAAEETEMPTIEMLSKGPRFSYAPYDSRVIDFTQRAQLMKRVLTMIERGLIRPADYVARQISFYSEPDVQQLFREYGRTADVKVEVLAARDAPH